MRFTDRRDDGVGWRMFFEQPADGLGRFFERDAALDDLRPGKFEDTFPKIVVRNEGAVRRGRHLETAGDRKARARHARKRTSLAADDLEAIVFGVEGCREICHLLATAPALYSTAYVHRPERDVLGIWNRTRDADSRPCVEVSSV